MPSSTPFILPNVPVDLGIPLRNLTLSWVGYVGRPQGDVEACNSIPICFIATLDTFDVDVAFPVLFTYISTPWTCLACVAGPDLSESYALPFSRIFQCVSEEAVGDAVDFAGASFAPFSSALSEMSKPLDSDVCVETFGEFDDFVAYLPHPHPNIVSLLSAEPFEFESSLASGYRISIPLEFGSSLLKMELFAGNILTIVCLFQNLTLVNYGYGDFGAVYVYAHPVGSDNGLRHVILKHSKEFEVLLHYDAGHLPTFLEMFLKALIGSISAYGKPYSSMVESKAEGRVASLCLLEAEETPVKADYALMYVAINGFSVAPSVAGSLNHKLAGYMVLVHECPIGSFVQLSSASNTVRSFKGLLHYAQKGLIGFSKKLSLSVCRLKNIQNKTLLHVADPKRNDFNYLNKFTSQFLSALSDGASLRCKVKD